jgi:type IV secretory pathway TrbD component
MSRKTPTYQCLQKPILVGGCERTPVVLVAGATLMCCVIAWFTWSLLSIIAAGLLFLVGIPVLQRLAKRDPRMVEITFRYAAYQRHYRAYPVREGRAPREAGPTLGFIVLFLFLAIGLWVIAA